MNTPSLILAAAVALVGTSSAFAGSPAYIADGPDLFTKEAQAAQASTLTREQVKAELARVRAADPQWYIADRPPMQAPNDRPVSTLTRAQVTAEYLRARDAGELQHFSDYPVFTDKVVGAPSRSRADVRAEAVDAAKHPVR